MEKNFKFGSPVDEALFTALTPLSVRTDVFPVIYGPEEAYLLKEVLKDADENRIFLSGEGKLSLTNPEGEMGLFGNNNDYAFFFRTFEGNGNEKKTVYFRAETGDTGINVFSLNSDSEVNVFETIAVNYYDPEEEDAYRTRVFYRTVGFKPGYAYEIPRYFDLLSPLPEEVFTEADFFALREEEAEARKDELRRRIIEEAEYLRREVRRVETLIRTAETEEAGSEEDDLLKYLDLLESVREDFGAE